MVVSGKVYRVVKFVAQIGLPALGSLYFALAAIWGLPAPEKVIGSIIALDTFLGVLLGISQSNFKKQIATGTMKVAEQPQGRQFLLELDEDPEYELHNKKQVRLKIIKHPVVRAVKTAK